MTNNLLAGIHWAEVIGRAAQSTWCYFGEHQRRNQKPCLVPPSAWKYFFQILPLWSLKWLGLVTGVPESWPCFPERRMKRMQEPSSFHGNEPGGGRIESRGTQRWEQDF